MIVNRTIDGQWKFCGGAVGCDKGNGVRGLGPGAEPHTRNQRFSVFFSGRVAIVFLILSSVLH